MSNYILSVTVASLAAAVVELLAPKGEGGRLAASVRMVAGLFLLLSLLAPLRAGMAFLSGQMGELAGDLAYEAPDHESTLQASILAMGEAELTAWVREVLVERFSLPSESVEVIPVWEESDTTPPPLRELYIVFSGTAILQDPHPVEAYFETELRCPCRVSVG